MTTDEKLNLILSEVQDMKAEVQTMKTDVQDVKTDVKNVKTDVQELKQRVTNIELHLENGTDKNIQLIAENFIELTKKLNQAIPAADKNLAYEVKVNYLVEEVSQMKKDIAELKRKIA